VSTISICPKRNIDGYCLFLSGLSSVALFDAVVCVLVEFVVGFSVVVEFAVVVEFVDVAVFFAVLEDRM